jgi:hypothetical protein
MNWQNLQYYTRHLLFYHEFRENDDKRYITNLKVFMKNNPYPHEYMAFLSTFKIKCLRHDARYLDIGDDNYFLLKL